MIRRLRHAGPPLWLMAAMYTVLFLAGAYPVTLFVVSAVFRLASWLRCQPLTAAFLHRHRPHHAHFN